MSKIEVGRYSALLRRALGMSGTEDVAGDLSPELSPTWELEGPTDEWSFLKDVREIGLGETIANGAGAGHFRIRNPPGSGVLAVIKPISVAGDGTSNNTAKIQELTADLTNTSLAAARDTRWLTQSTFSHSAMVLSFQNTGGMSVGNGTIWLSRALASTEVAYKEEVILAPGFALTFGSLINNVSLFLTASWHERQLPALEGPD